MKLAVLTSILFATACAPASSYRNVGFVPAARPLPWDGRTTVAGRLRLEGVATVEGMTSKLEPTLHDSALHVSRLTLDGLAAFAVTSDVELGIRYSYAAYAWGGASASGTPPLPSHPALWGLGPELRVTLPLDAHRRFAMGLAGNVLAYSVPYAQWQRVSSCAPGVACFVDATAGGGNATYSLAHEGREAHWAMSFAAYPSFDLLEDGKAGHLFGGISLHSGFQNDGFTDTRASASAVQSAPFIFFLGGGYGVELARLRFSAMLAAPLDGAQVQYGPVAFFSLGGDIVLGSEARRFRP